ncbi:MAG: FecR domain-containing protein [Prevotella sp.]|nr:FecR domain-containing protein [Prevotella sp.]MBR1462237.1 FecR domain-containing protein [Prevotella sp.]
MSKKQINQLIFEKMAGTISPDDDALLNDWISESEDHRRIFDSFMKRTDFSQWMESAQMVDVDKAWQQFSANHPEQDVVDAGKGERKPARSMQWLKYAAVFAAAVVMTALFLKPGRRHPSPVVVSAEVQQVMDQASKAGKVGAVVENVSSWYDRESIAKEKHSPVEGEGAIPPILPSLSKEQLLSARCITTYHDKEFWLTLDDGTLVHLNYNTRLIHPQHFAGSSRDVYLDGEAYFMVAKDKSHPFIVHTTGGDVKVYGTEFNVSTQSSATTVVLVKGSVSVSVPNGSEQMMNPGQQAVLSIGESAIQIEEVDVDPYIAWNSGTFAFRYQPLGKVMDVLSKWYSVEVEYGSNDIRDMQIVGDFDRYEILDNILDAISKSTGLGISLKGGKVMIRQ